MEISNSINIRSSKAEVFTALITPSLIRQWWQATYAIVVAREKGLFAVAWGDEDNPDYVSAASIQAIDPPNKLRLTNFIYSVKDKPVSCTDDSKAEFYLKDTADGILLKVLQTGFGEDSYEYIKACDKGWKDVLMAIKSLIESDINLKNASDYLENTL